MSSRRMIAFAAAIHCMSRIEAIETRGWGRPLLVAGSGAEIPGTLLHHAKKPADKVRLITVTGKDLLQKGVDLLLDGVAMARGALSQWGAVLAIYAPDVQCIALQRMVERFRLTDLVTVRGPLTPERKQRTFLNSDLFVLTSRYEGHPQPLLEALGFGVPCLVTPGTNIGQDVVQAGAGWEVEPYPEDIAKGLTYALEKRHLFSAMGDKARALAIAKYSWTQAAEGIVARYRALLAKPNSDRTQREL